MPDVRNVDDLWKINDTLTKNKYYHYYYTSETICDWFKENDAEFLAFVHALIEMFCKDYSKDIKDITDAILLIYAQCEKEKEIKNDK